MLVTPDTPAGHENLRIDIIFDTVCPWSYIGKRRLEEAQRMRPGLGVEIHWWPFLLNPTLPPEGVDHTAYLARKFGSEARVRRIYGAIGKAGQSVEIDFDFSHIRHTPNTLNSHCLIGLAAADGKADDAVEAIFRAYFIEGRDIGDADVLVDLAGELGLDTGAVCSHLAGRSGVDAVLQENARAHRLGINSVPTYVFADHLIISGAQEAPVLACMLDAAASVPVPA